MEGRCGTCKHWKTEANRLWGCCRPLADRTDVIIIYGPEEPDFHTAADFGCVLWEKVDESGESDSERAGAPEG